METTVVALPTTLPTTPRVAPPLPSHSGGHHAAADEATVAPAAAARALGVRRETVYRLVREGKLGSMRELGDAGEERLRIPVRAIEQRLREVGRGPQATVAATTPLQEATGAGHSRGHHALGVELEQLLLAEKTISTLQAQLAAERSLICAAAARLDAPQLSRWWRRRRERSERLVEAAAALRQLAALPASTPLDADEHAG